MCISDHMQGTFFCLGKFLKKLADNQCFSITKGSIYYIKHMYIQPFNTEVDWAEICHLKEVSTMFSICRYCIFTLWKRTLHASTLYLPLEFLSHMHMVQTP